MMRHGKFWSLIVMPMLAGAASQNAATNVSAPPLPAIHALELQPGRLTFKNARDERRVLVRGRTDGSNVINLTAQAVLKTDSPAIEINEGYIRGKEKGSAEVLISANGQTVKLPVDVESGESPAVRFVRDVQPILAKAGCNQGTCHGSAKGKNGFKLSLRGYDPDFDYQALINDMGARRFNRAKPEESLMLLKPTAEVPHEGRQAIKPGSREYKLLRDWIAEGTKSEEAKAGRATGVEILPGDVEMD